MEKSRQGHEQPKAEVHRVAKGNRTLARRGEPCFQFAHHGHQSINMGDDPTLFGDHSHFLKWVFKHSMVWRHFGVVGWQTVF